MIVVGLTGGLAAGKSTVAAMLARKGAAILDADKTAHELIAQNGVCHNAVIRKFGKDILDAGGSIDRRKLGEIVFNDKTELKNLTQIIHPLVDKGFRSKINAYRKGGKVKVVVMDVPLLFESGMDQLADVTVTVSLPRRDQLKRATGKLKVSKQDALKRIKNQMPLSRKILLSDIIIDNRGSLKDLQKKVDAVWNRLVRLN